MLVTGWWVIPDGLWGAALRVFGIVPLITGLIGWSPIYALFGWSSRRRNRRHRGCHAASPVRSRPAGRRHARLFRTCVSHRHRQRPRRADEASSRLKWVFLATLVVLFVFVEFARYNLMPFIEQLAGPADDEPGDPGRQPLLLRHGLHHAVADAGAGGAAEPGAAGAASGRPRPVRGPVARHAAAEGRGTGHPTARRALRRGGGVRREPRHPAVRHHRPDAGAARRGSARRPRAAACWGSPCKRAGVCGWTTSRPTRAPPACRRATRRCTPCWRCRSSARDPSAATST